MEHKFEPRTLDDTKIGELIEKARKEGREEAKLILVTNEVSRQGPSCDVVRNIEIVYGDAEKIALREECQPYPGVCRSKVAILPKTVPVVVIAYYYNDCADTEQREAMVYIFTGNEWRSLYIDNLP